MLFQPTDITPSVLGTLGNGTVDVNSGLTVSWQVSGSSPLVAFAVTIYLNNPNSTELYATGKLTDGCPFYGRDETGAVQRFSYSIPREQLVVARIGNGGELKLRITQYYRESGSLRDTAVEQTAAAVFRTRTTPTLQLAEIPWPLTTKSHTFSAVYSQSDGDSLSWRRWEIESITQVDGEDAFSHLLDTGNIYGAAPLQISYDGFVPEKHYRVRCTVQTENGITVTATSLFDTVYTPQSINGFLTAKRQKQKSAVRLDWSAASVIPGVADGEYMLADGKVQLLSGGIAWNRLNGEPFFFRTPWAIAYRCTVVALNAKLFTFDCYNQSGSRLFIGSLGHLYFYNGATQILLCTGICVNDELSVVITPEKIYVTVLNASGGLYPAETQYPAETLLPCSGNTIGVQHEVAVSLDQRQMQAVYLGTSPEEISTTMQICDYLQVFDGDIPAAQLSAMRDGSYVPNYTVPTDMLANFTNGIDASNLPIDAADMNGYAVYRQEVGQPNMVKVASVGLQTQGLYDYAVKNQKTYLYRVYLQSDTQVLAAPLLSGEVTPFFWDWTLLECSEDANSGFRVLREFRFGKNLTSGGIGNNNTPQLLKNFTRYPVVQVAPQNYQSGTLTSLIGVIDEYGQYSDSDELREAIFALSATTHALFLKDRKGQLLRVRTSGAISLEYWDASAQQAQTVSLPWAEIGGTDGVCIVGEV